MRIIKVQVKKIIKIKLKLKILKKKQKKVILIIMMFNHKENINYGVIFNNKQDYSQIERNL